MEKDAALDLIRRFVALEASIGARPTKAQRTREKVLIQELVVGLTGKKLTKEEINTFSDTLD